MTCKNGVSFTNGSKWNVKYYESKILGRPELNRIYIDEEEIHVTQEELQKVQREIWQAKETEQGAIMSEIYELFHKLNNENKAKILSRITCSYLYDKIKNDEQKVDELWKINENWIKTVKEA